MSFRMAPSASSAGAVDPVERVAREDSRKGSFGVRDQQQSFALPNSSTPSRAFGTTDELRSLANVAQLSLLEASRRDYPQLDDRDRVVRLADGLLLELAERPPISLDTVAAYQGISEIAYAPLPNAGCLVTEPTGRSKICLRLGDHPRRQRFSGFHEVIHTFMPGYQLQIQWRCDPPVLDQSEASTEALCDHGAGEMLLPSRFVLPDLEAASFGMATVVTLADTYEASLQAAAHRFVSLWPEDSLLIVAEIGNKPREANDPSAAPKLRVKYGWRRGDWPFIRPHKSFDDGDPAQRALAGELVDERTALEGVSGERLPDVQVSARLCPYTDQRGMRRDRVLALYRRLCSR